MFDNFSLFSCLKINNAKCGISGIGVKQEVKMAMCQMECIDLTDDVTKILGIYSPYNKETEQEGNYLNHIVKIQNYWRENRCFKIISNF